MIDVPLRMNTKLPPYMKDGSFLLQKLGLTSCRQDFRMMRAHLGVMMGVAYAVPPGPVNIEAARRGLTGGFPVTLAMQLGAVIGDTTYAVLALAGVGLVLTHALAQALLGIVGTGLLLYLGWSASAGRASPPGSFNAPRAAVAWR